MPRAPRHESEYYGWARRALEEADRDRRRLRGEGEPVEVLDLAELVRSHTGVLITATYEDAIPDTPPPRRFNFTDLFPDGEDLTQAWFGGTGLWTTLSGNLKALANNGITIPLLYRGFSAYTLCSCKAHMDHTTSAFTAGGVCIRASYSGATANNGYFLKLARPGGIGTDATYTLFKVFNGASSTIASGTTPFADGDQLGLDHDGTKLHVLVNGAAIDLAADTDVASGSCGLWVSDSTVQFQDVIITDDRP